MPLLSKHSFFIMSLFDPYNIYYRKQSKTVNGQVIRKKPQDTLEYAVTRQEIPRALSVLSSFPDAVPVTEIPFSYTFIGSFVLSNIVVPYEGEGSVTVKFSHIWPTAIQSFINPFLTNTDDFFSFYLLLNIQAARFNTIEFPQEENTHSIGFSFEGFNDRDDFAPDIQSAQSMYINGETATTVHKQLVYQSFTNTLYYIAEQFTKKPSASESACISRHYDEGLSVLNSIKLGSYDFNILQINNLTYPGVDISISSVTIPYTLTLSGVMKYRITI